MLKLFMIESNEIPPRAEAHCTTMVTTRLQPMVIRMRQEVANAFDLIRLTAGREIVLDLEQGQPALHYLNCGIRAVVLEPGQPFTATVRNNTDEPERIIIEVWGQLRDRNPGRDCDRYLRILYEAEDSRRKSAGGELGAEIESHYAAKLDAIHEHLSPAEIDLIESEATRLLDGGALPWSPATNEPKGED